ncbi:MAG: hypothetical protein P8X96_25010 [Desulfobacteraceae bacterium]
MHDRRTHINLSIQRLYCMWSIKLEQPGVVHFAVRSLCAEPAYDWRARGRGVSGMWTS